MIIVIATKFLEGKPTSVGDRIMQSINYMRGVERRKETN